MLLTMCSALSSAIPLVVQEMKKHIRFGSQQILEMQKGLHLELWNVNPISTSADCGDEFEWSKQLLMRVCAETNKMVMLRGFWILTMWQDMITWDEDLGLIILTER